MKNYKKQDIHFDTFEELKQAAATTYTISLKSVCQELKCSRSWANNYIRPHVKSIYVSNGYGTGGPNYAQKVSKYVNMLNGEEDKLASFESIYLHEAEYRQLIRDSIISCQKRSKQVYKSIFVGRDNLVSYYTELVSLYLELIDENTSLKEAKRISLRIRSLYLEYVNDEAIKEVLKDATVYPTKRTDAPFVNVVIPDAPISDWKCIHDELEYGDIEETIYRRFFKQGFIRLELRIPDKDGVIKETGKVYYVPDPHPVRQLQLSLHQEMAVINSFDDTEKARDALGKVINLDAFNITELAWGEYLKLM